MPTFVFEIISDISINCLPERRLTPTSSSFKEIEMKPYNPETPRNVACWAVVQAFGSTRQKAIDALVEAGIHDAREWQEGISVRKQAENHVNYLERNGWYEPAE